MIVHQLRARKAKMSNRVNPWDMKDTCDNWFSTGTAKSVESDPALRMVEFRPSKFALEVPSQVKQSWIKIFNPSSNFADVYLNYMAIGPWNTTYPTMNVSLSNNNAATEDNNAPNSVIVDGFANYTEYGAQPLHLVQQALIGRVRGPGVVTIALHETKSGKDPFRIAGVVLTPSFDDSLDNHHSVSPIFHENVYS